MNLTILLLIGLIFTILYVLYLFLKSAALTKGIIAMTKITEVEAEKLDYMGRDIYYDGWIFVYGSQVGQDNIFINREIGISIGGSNGTTMKIMKVDIAPFTEVETITTDLPLQKWVFFAVRYKSDVLEVYLNGKLIKTVYINDNLVVKTSKDAKLIIGSANISGYLTKIRRLVNPPDSNKIWEYYLEGNGQFSGLIGSILNYFDNYDAVISVYKNEIKQREQKLF